MEDEERSSVWVKIAVFVVLLLIAGGIWFCLTFTRPVTAVVTSPATTTSTPTPTIGLSIDPGTIIE